MTTFVFGIGVGIGFMMLLNGINAQNNGLISAALVLMIALSAGTGRYLRGQKKGRI